MRDRDICLDNRAAYEYCRDNGHMDFIRTAEKCDRYVRSKQWDPRVVARLDARRKPHITVNKILPTFATLAGEHISRRGDLSFRAAAGGDPATASVLDKLWVHFSQTNLLEWTEALVFWDGVIRGRGFFDLRVSFDENMQGEPELSYLNSKDVLLYPGDKGYDPDKWSGVIVTRHIPAYDVAELYGAPLSDVLVFADHADAGSDYADWTRDTFGEPHTYQMPTDARSHAKHRLVRVIERQEWEYHSVECFVEPITGEVREVPQAWDREKVQLAIAQFGYATTKRRVRKVRWTASAGELALHDAVSPYQHLTPIMYAPFFIGGAPMGVVEHLLSPQDLLNKMLSQELHIVGGIANSGYVVKKGSLANMNTDQLRERGSEDNVVIEVNNDVNTDVVRLKPNPVPTGIDRLSYKASEAISEISLVSETMQGMDRADVSGDAIEQKKDRGSVALTPIYTTLDQTRRLIGRNWLDLSQRFVTEQRVYHIAVSTTETEQVEVNTPDPENPGKFLHDLTLGEYGISVVNVKARDSYEQHQVEMLLDMHRLGAPIPWSEIIKLMSVLENKDAIVAKMKALEGDGGPSEEEKARIAADLRLVEAQATDKEASAQAKMAAAQAKQAESMKGDGAEQAKIVAQQQSLEIERAKASMEMEIKQMDADLKRQQMEMQMQMERQRYELELEKARAEFMLQMRKMQMELEKTRATVDAAHEKNAVERERMELGVERDIRANQVMEERTQLEMDAQKGNIEMQKKAAEAKTKLQLEQQRRKAERKPEKTVSNDK
jgi:hypothetical protein